MAPSRFLGGQGPWEGDVLPAEPLWEAHSPGAGSSDEQKLEPPAA